MELDVSSEQQQPQMYDYQAEAELAAAPVRLSDYQNLTPKEILGQPSQQGWQKVNLDYAGPPLLAQFLIAVLLLSPKSSIPPLKRHLLKHPPTTTPPQGLPKEDHHPLLYKFLTILQQHSTPQILGCFDFVLAVLCEYVAADVVGDVIALGQFFGVGVEVREKEAWGDWGRVRKGFVAVGVGVDQGGNQSNLQGDERSQPGSLAKSYPMSEARSQAKSQAQIKDNNKHDIQPNTQKKKSENKPLYTLNKQKSGQKSDKPLPPRTRQNYQKIKILERQRTEDYVPQQQTRSNRLNIQQLKREIQELDSIIKRTQTQQRQFRYNRVNSPLLYFSSTNITPKSNELNTHQLTFLQDRSRHYKEHRQPQPSKWPGYQPYTKHHPALYQKGNLFPKGIYNRKKVFDQGRYSNSLYYRGISDCSNRQNYYFRHRPYR